MQDRPDRPAARLGLMKGSACRDVILRTFLMPRIHRSAWRGCMKCGSRVVIRYSSTHEKEMKSMQPEVAIEYVLSKENSTTSFSTTPSQSSAGEQPSPLIRREKEVAVLVGRGLTNRQIVSELVISERTVDHHVAKILKKLDLHSREQVTAPMPER